MLPITVCGAEITRDMQKISMAFVIFSRMRWISGRMKSYQGWEEDFGQKLAEEIPAVSEEEAEQIVRTAREAAYGNPEEFSGENYQAAYTGCLKIRSYIFSKIPATRRFLYYLRVSFRQFSL